MRGPVRKFMLAALAVVVISAVSLPGVASTTWVVGDVFAAVSGGSYQVYDNTGVFKETISDGQGGFTTGCAFNLSLDKLYTTNFSANNVVVYDNADPHAIAQTIPTAPASNESVVFAGDGSFYVGHADGAADIEHYDSAGTLIDTFDVATEARGSDWLDLAADQATMFYTSEGSSVKRFDVAADAQLADFSTGTLTGGPAFALRLLPPGDGSGGLLVANTSDIKRLDGTGAIVQTYDAPGEDGWFALNRDPNGTSFWSGDFSTANFYRFNIATGAIEVGPINTGTGSSTLFGLCVKGELTSVSHTCEVRGVREALLGGDEATLANQLLGTEDEDGPLSMPLHDVDVALDDIHPVVGSAAHEGICVVAAVEDILGLGP